MIGLELTINGRKIAAAIQERRIIGIYVTQRREEVFINFSGTDFATSRIMSWYDSSLKNGDEIIMEVKEVKDTKPISMSESPQTCCCVSPEGEEQNQQDLEEYYSLRELLMERGVLGETGEK